MKNGKLGKGILKLTIKKGQLVLASSNMKKDNSEQQNLKKDTSGKETSETWQFWKGNIWKRANLERGNRTKDDAGK